MLQTTLLKLLIPICFFLDYRLLFLWLLMMTLSMFFFGWKRHSKSTIVAVILNNFAQQTNTYSKSAAETLRANSKNCTSLLTTCSMSKTLFKRFAATISCSMYLLAILNVFHSLIYFYLLSALYWVQKKPRKVFFKKGCPLDLRNIFRKTPVLGFLFNKVVDRQDRKYIEERLQHRCFVRNSQMFLGTLFLKKISERLLL